MAYVARYGEGDEQLTQVALCYPRSCLPGAIVDYVLALEEVDVAVRWSIGVEPPQALVLLAACSDPLPPSGPLDHALVGARRPLDRAEHDRLVGQFGSRHLGPDELEGEVGGIALVMGFRLLPVMERFAPLARAFGWRVHYQANLRKTRRDPELERALRKRAVRLSESSALPEPVRVHQMKQIECALANRWWIDEAIALDDAAAAAHLGRMSDDELAASGAQVGFGPGALIEGDRSPLFAMGLHFSRGGWPSPSAAAGCAVDAAFARRLLSWDPLLGTRVALGAATRLAGPARVFVSYSQPDLAVAESIVIELEEHGIRCWIAPRDIDAGRAYPDAIVTAIEQSALMVVLLSNASQQSPHVLREVERAVSKRVPIVPLRLEPITLTKEMEYFVSIPQWLDATTQPIGRVLAALRERVARELPHA